MTEPKRWTTRDLTEADPDEAGWGEGWEDIRWVAAADFDRLRDERDEMIRVSAANIATTQRNMDELRCVAGVLADALRETMGNMDSGYRDTPTIYRQARSALAVFDTLTEGGSDGDC